MKTLLFWSGPRGQELAEALSTFLDRVVPGVDYWVSTRLPLGKAWRQEVEGALSSSLVAIACFTTDSREARWIHYEAGRVAGFVADDRRLIPYTLDFQPEQLGDPLAAFSGRTADRAGTLELARTLAELNGHSPSPEAISFNFDKAWDALAASLEDIRTRGTEAATVPDPVHETLAEILAVQRRLEVQLLHAATTGIDSRPRAVHDPRTAALGELGSLVMPQVRKYGTIRIDYVWRTGVLHWLARGWGDFETWEYEFSQPEAFPPEMWSGEKAREVAAQVGAKTMERFEYEIEKAGDLEREYPSSDIPPRST